MAISQTYLFKNCLEYIPIDRIKTDIPDYVRGVYVLYNSPDGSEMDVVYVGMSRGEKTYGVRSRVIRHALRKVGLWTHVSVYEVWDNITKSQVEELEGLFRHVYRKDKTANALNKQRGSKLIANIRREPNKLLITTFAGGSRLSTKSRRTRQAVGARPPVVTNP